METGKSAARLRMLRDLLGRTASEDEGEETEAGFTLIELMVVLLIMGILLAIAIPTFLSVTGGAKKTAAQSDLTNSLTTASAIYTNNNGSGFPTTGTPTVTTTSLQALMHKTQNTITYLVGGAAVTTATKGKNVISTYRPAATSNLVVFATLDTNKVCWVAVDNESGAPGLSTIPSGNSFGAATSPTTGDCTATKIANAPRTYLTAASTATPTVAGAIWFSSFATVPNKT